MRFYNSIVCALIMISFVQSYGAQNPPFWDEAPGSFSEYPHQDGIIVIDPWNYMHRLGLYKIMLSATEPYFKEQGINNTGNVLWGLPLQHGWQFSSGRLVDVGPHLVAEHGCSSKPSSRELCMSPYNWWASMNYQLAVIPFLGAMKAGKILN